MEFPRRVVLFMTNSEHGQANVILATAYEFLLQEKYDVHIASYDALASRIQKLNQQVASASKSRATFHSVGRVSLAQYTANKNLIWSHGTSITGVAEASRTMGLVSYREDNKEYLKSYDTVSVLLRKLNPIISVIDPIYFFGIDACRTAGVEFLVLSPQSFYETAALFQPNGAVVWKYPCVCSGFPFPLPWYLIPINLLMLIILYFQFVLGSAATSLTAARAAHGIPYPLQNSENTKDKHVICPTLPAIDFPVAVIPSKIHGIGPIILPIRPVSDSDPALARWLRAHPTILVNLGTHHTSSPSAALEMAHAFAEILTSHPAVQILWKLKYDYQSDVYLIAVLKPFLSSDRIRISPWLVPDVSSILVTGEVRAFVHHGGANSYFEACYAGLPHVVVPAWYDCYLNAAKVEHLGIGVYANKNEAPEVERGALRTALEKVLSDVEVVRKAKEIGVLCRKTCGRERAREVIEEIIKSVKEKRLKA